MALTKPMQQVRTLTANNPPANGTLLEGQLSIEYNPPRLWAGGPGGTTNVQLAGGGPFLPLTAGQTTVPLSGGLRINQPTVGPTDGFALNVAGDTWPVYLWKAGAGANGALNISTSGLNIASLSAAGSTFYSSVTLAGDAVSALQ